MSSVERQIVGALVLCLTDQGFRVELCDSDGGGLYLYAMPDGGERPADGHRFWVRLVEGNGADIISDYSTVTEGYILSVLKLAETLAEVEAA